MMACVVRRVVMDTIMPRTRGYSEHVGTATQQHFPTVQSPDAVFWLIGSDWKCVCVNRTTRRTSSLSPIENKGNLTNEEPQMFHQTLALRQRQVRVSSIRGKFLGL